MLRTKMENTNSNSEIRCKGKQIVIAIHEGLQQYKNDIFFNFPKGSKAVEKHFFIFINFI